MSEHATPFFGADAEAVKERAAAFEDLRQAFDEHDCSDPDSWMAIVTNGKAMMLAGEEQIPNVVYGLGHLLITAVDAADKTGNQMLSMMARMAMMKVLEESKDSSSTEETGNENDHTDASS
jgi:hypothetical protein